MPHKKGEFLMKYHVKRHEVIQPLDQSIRLIPLTQGQNAIVDSADYEWLMQWNWYAKWSVYTQSFYAKNRKRKNGRFINTWMHRLVIGSKPEEVGDHINGNTLDNRRSNLRPATVAQNGQNHRPHKHNRSGHTGVGWYKEGRKWRAHIQVNMRFISLGYFDTMEEAIQARHDAELKHYGEFAYLHRFSPATDHQL